MSYTDSNNIAELATIPSNFALLVNARPEKGFDLLLQISALCPSIHFVAIASQSSIEAALNAVRRSGMKNVSIIPRTDQINLLYERARVVMVPSYRFLETFSRVCIEAQRYGTPVLGADRGNVPLLLRESGFVLPEDPLAWAEQLRILWANEEAYAAACRAAMENSARYSKAAQLSAFDRVVGGANSSMLIGIGSGVGNMLHLGPMIRNIARHLGNPVDLVVSQDHSDSLFLLQDPNYVNEVHTLHPPILERHYDTVFLTHSFGSARLPFSADRILYSRDWDNFQPGGSLHETIFNLEAAKALLGVDYNPEDILRHYVSDINYDWRDGPVVGIHGGSKPGYWASKRWPGFPELVSRLKERGFRVVSYGTPDEFVEGTEDSTGGTIEQMARDMRICSWFVSNDSGVMNLANALGIPVLSLFAPTDVETRKPLAAHNVALSAARDCAPCEVKNPRSFKDALCNCIASISVDDVLSAFDKMRASKIAAVFPSPALETSL